MKIDIGTFNGQVETICIAAQGSEAVKLGKMVNEMLGLSEPKPTPAVLKVNPEMLTDQPIKLGHTTEQGRYYANQPFTASQTTVAKAVIDMAININKVFNNNKRESFPKIQCIRTIRTLTGLGLKEAKDLYEGMYEELMGSLHSY